MRVFEIMSGRVMTVSPDAKVAEARALLDRHRVRHLVVTVHGEVVGVVSDRDLAGPSDEGLSVAHVMTSPAITIESTDTAKKAANLMEARTIDCLPVTVRGQLAGILTTTDLLRAVGKKGVRPDARSRRTLNHRVPHRKTHSATGKW
jgi:acetoin utilization protein AcuB